MKRRFLLLIPCFIFLFTTLNAQIDKEIKQFTDSTEIIVGNGRRMLLSKAQEKDFAKVGEIYNYLTGITSGKKISSFHFIEDYYINILLGNWDHLTTYMKNFNSLGHRFIYRNMPEIEQGLSDLISDSADSLLAECRNSIADEETYKLFEIVFYCIKNGADGTYNDMIGNYIKKYKGTSYNDFIQGFLPRHKIPGSLTFSMGSGIVIPTANLGDYFNPSACLNMSMDMNIDKIFSSLYFNTSWPGLQIPFSASNGYENLNFTKNEIFEYMNGGLKCGYFLTRNKKFLLSPFLSVEATSIMSNRFDDETNDREVKLVNSFSYGAGVHSEIRIATFRESYNAYWSYPVNSYLSLKMEGGLSAIARAKDPSFKGNVVYFIFGIIWGMGDF